MKSNKMIIFSAPSGAGKTTITKEMIARIPEMSFSVSATNRAPRGTEQNGIEYYFLTTEEFKGKVAAGEFVEWEEVYPGRFYGTLKSELSRMIQAEQVPVFDIDVKGGCAIKKQFGDDALFIFIKAPIEVIEARLLARNTDDVQSIKDRIARIPEELSYEDKADVVIENIDLQKSFDMCERVILDFLKK